MKYIYGIDIKGADMWKITTIIDGEIYKMKVLIQEWNSESLFGENIDSTLSDIDRIDQLLIQHKREVCEMEYSFANLLAQSCNENSSRPDQTNEYITWCVFTEKILELKRTLDDMEMASND